MTPSHLSPERINRIREALMARQTQTFPDFGIPDDPAELTDRLAELMFNLYPAFTVDELLLRPREAVRFCDAARQQTGYFDLPDDVILRALLNRRKKG